MPSLEVKLNRTDRIYRPGDIVSGVIYVSTSAPNTHNGIKLTFTGNVLLQLSPRVMNMLESIYSNIKPVQLVSEVIEVAPAGRLSEGTTEYLFSFPLKLSTKEPLLATSDGRASEEALESYHGAYISIQYVVTADMVRSLLVKSPSTSLELIIERKPVPRSLASPRTMVPFTLTPELQKHCIAPILHSGGFKVSGNIAVSCAIAEPLVGEVCVESAGLPIKSIDLQVLRVETVDTGDKVAKETTLVQSTQVADGDICRGLTLPIYVILPRLFTCPDVVHSSFSIAFESCINVNFAGGPDLQLLSISGDGNKRMQACATFPLQLYR